MKKLSSVCGLLSIVALSWACATQKPTAKAVATPAKAAVDSTKAIAKTPPKKEEKGPKAYKKFIDTTFTTRKGMITVHKKDDKYYFAIPHSLLNREIMTITRYSKTAAGGGIFGGEEVNRQVVKWEKGPNDNLFLRTITYVVTSPDSTKPMFQAVRNSSADPIIGAFKIEAMRRDSIYVIDVTSTFDGDNQVFSLDPITKQMFNIMAIKKEGTYIESINAYPTNVEIRTVKTYSVSPPRISITPSPMPQVGTYFPASRDAGVVTVELNTSMVLLPLEPMRRRMFDYRVGYFANQYAVFKEESQQSDKDVFAVRWRLEPKNEADAARQQRGELIEPKKPIVYYIDPATPLKWRPFLKQGVDDWNKAFEAAGWKNAIRGEYWPEKDSTMSLEDARFSVIRYFAADIQNAYGPNVHDPRTGEILESHIGWYHNVMRLLRNWYLVQTAAVDPRARSKAFDDQLMGELVRFVSSHEVGHTLGLRHNMGASSATPVEKLRDKEWLAKNGHTSSIMDYARFNYVAQPQDGVTDLFPRIGDYDVWAIKWGYSYFPQAKSEEDEAKILNEWTKEAYKNPRLRFGTEISPYDPRYQTEDLGDNAMRASAYGIENLKRIVPNLVTWSKEEGKSYQELDELYSNVVGQYRRYIGHVTKNVGGIYETPRTYDMDGVSFEAVPRAIQQEAVAFLNSQVFSTPNWLLNQEILGRVKPEAGVEALKSIQSSTLDNLFAGDRLVRLMETSSMNANNYSLISLMDELRGGILSELRGRNSIDLHRRNLQKVFVDKLISLLKPGKATVMSIPVGITYGFSGRTVDLAQTDVPSAARATLAAIRSDLLSASGRMSDRISRYHVQDLADRIKEALEPK